MKEFSIEEKARRYNEAIKVIKGNLNALNEITETGAEVVNIQSIKNCFYRAFPELKESEDERIRACIEMCLTDANEQRFKDYNTNLKECLDWLEKQGNLVKYYEDKLDRCACSNFNKGYKKALEKQGEQKTVDKVESKFHEGDWIVSNLTGTVALITRIDDCGHIFTADKTVAFTVGESENNYHLWTLADAKDGDVLVDEDSNIGIYKEIEGICWHSYIYLGCNKRLYGFSLGGSHVQNNTKPAIKEQRDILFQKMKETGYEWDAEKKELKIIDWSKHIKYEPNSPSITKEFPTWSEEDEKNSLEIKCLIGNYRTGADEYRLDSWIDHLKNRVQPKPKREWGEEDKEVVEALNYYVKDLDLFFSGIKIGDKNIQSKEFREKVQHWLKSLKDRVGCEVDFTTTWKPSEEQMKALDIAIRCGIQLGTWEEDALKSLKEQLFKLKKLRNE